MDTRKWFLTPSGVMWIVIGMYAAKVVLKLSVGLALDVPAVYGDGFHNVSDIVEATTVLVILWLARRNDEQYPNGRGNIESLGVFIEGGLLLLVAANVAWESLVGLWRWSLPSASPSGAIDYAVYGWTAALYVASAVASFAVSRRQVAVGRAHNRPLVVADGEETLSDAYVELGVLAGVIGVLVFKSVLWGYLAGLLVTWKLVETGVGLFRRGLDALLQRTIGLEHERNITQLLTETPGVLPTPECRAWRVGGCVMVTARIILGPSVSAEAVRDLKKALRPRVSQYLRESDMPESRVFIRFDAGAPEDSRVAYLVNYRDGLARTSSLATATHLYTCDLRRGRITRIVEDTIPRSGLAELLSEKRVSVVMGWSEEAAANLPCPYRAATTPFPPVSVE